MCGRITQKSNPKVLGLKIATLVEPLFEAPPRYNGAPSQEHWVIRQHPETGERTLDRLTWGLIPGWIKEASPKLKPINATAERVATAPMFRRAYAKRRCLLPIDNFFEWKAIKGAKAKQPFAIAMKSCEPFALAAIWENWQRPGTDEWVRTFCVITTDANELARTVHDRMPVILRGVDADAWIDSAVDDPKALASLLRPFPAKEMIAFPVSTRVNKVSDGSPHTVDG